MAVAVPAAYRLTCPRCKSTRFFVSIDGGVTQRCKGCEWQFTMSTQAPTSTDTATLAVGGTALTVASGGASFTNGMFLLFDTGANAEVLVVNGSSTATNIPVTSAPFWPVFTGAVKAHGSNATFGQLLLTPSFNAAGEQAVPAAPGWGF